MSNFENETPAGYVTIEQAAQTETEAGQFWELHPDVTISGFHRDTEGWITGEYELSHHAAITDVELWDEDGTFSVYGNQHGDNFALEANVELWTPVRLVDER